MARAELADIVNEALALNNTAEAKRIVDVVLSELKEEIIKENGIRISGLGTFKIVTREPHLAVIPNKGPVFVEVPRRKLVKFYPSKKFIEGEQNDDNLL